MPSPERKWPPDPEDVVVSDADFAFEEDWGIVSGNINFVNALRHECVYVEEISSDAMRSYNVDYYLAQVNNGGFSQFLYNSKWSPAIVASVREGLLAIGAAEHLKLFEEAVAIVERIGPEDLQKFIGGWYGDTLDICAELDATCTSRFYELDKSERLTRLNAAWLRSLPALRVATLDEIKAEVERRGAALPYREERKRKRLEDEPRYKKLMRALSRKAGHEFVQVTTGRPSRGPDGKIVTTWHFLTDKGVHYLVETGSKAIMYDKKTKRPVVAISTREGFGSGLRHALSQVMAGVGFGAKKGPRSPG